MQINRDNYENFFLLYVDGELAPADMKIVEEFTAANPDLLHELELLKETILPADQISFDSSFLLKGALINDQLQEKLLLKLDHELPAGQLAALNGMLVTDKALAAEYALLERTKIDANEEVIFEDKHLLYRREKDNVVIGRFIRWAAAAILVGFGLFIGYEKLNKAQVKEFAGTKPDKELKKTVGTGNPSQKDNNDPDNIAAVNEQNSSDSPVINAEEQQRRTNRPNEQQVASKNNNGNNSTVKVPAPGQTLPDDQQQNIAQPALANNNREMISPKNSEKPSPLIAEVIKPKKAAGIDESIVPLENPYANVTSLTDADRSENKILYMDEDVVKKSKAGGIFRKVKRFVERTAKIKTGSSVSIGAFQLGSD